MADTIALRNTALLLLLMIVASYLWHARRELAARATLAVACAVVAWALYLLVFPTFISRDSGVAWQSLKGQWGPGLLAIIAGAGLALAAAKRRVQSKHLVFWMGLASCVPNLIHLVLYAYRIAQTGEVSLGFWGRESHHADLGYAAGQSVVLLTVALLVDGRRRVRWAAAALIAACILSTVLASSRAGQAFAVFGVALASWSVLRRYGIHLVRQHGGLILIGVLITGLLAAYVIRHDPRWQHIGMLVKGYEGDPLRIACEGMDYIKGEMGVNDDVVTMHILQGDGSRLAVLRGGLELSKSAPWGVDGSRQAYQKLLRQHCPEPAYAMAHTHNGWLDTALALGWLGAALYLWVLLAFMVTGSRGARRTDGTDPWAHVLFAASVFWIVRGFTDSVFRDHMLEMQGFVLAFAFVMRASERGKDHTSD